MAKEPDRVVFCVVQFHLNVVERRWVDGLGGFEYH
jgi:hypothetical protein